MESSRRAQATASPGGNSHPSVPTVSGCAPPLAAITGVARAIASTTVRPKGSAGAAARSKAERASNCVGSSMKPAHSTDLERSSSVASCLRWESCVPRPAITSVQPQSRSPLTDHARSTTSVCFSFSSRCITSTRRSRVDGPGSVVSTPLGRTRFEWTDAATNSLMAICSSINQPRGIRRTLRAPEPRGIAK